MCDDLHLDARGSLNSGGRAFHDVSWSLQKFIPATDVWESQNDLFEYIQPDLETLSDGMIFVTSTRDLKVFVPMRTTKCPGGMSPEAEGWNACWNSTFFPAGQYEMRLGLTNWIGGTSQVDFAFEKLDVPVPLVQMANGVKMITQSSKALFLQGVSLPSECTSGLQPDLIHSWTVTPTITVGGSAWSPAKGQVVSLPPFALTSGKIFTFKFTARAGQSAASVVIDVQVDDMPPVARLQGGDRLISISQMGPPSYILDASSSESTKIQRGSLFYYWTCYQNVKLVDAVIGLQKFDCALIASEDAYQGRVQLVLESEKLRKHAFTFSPNLRIPSYTTGCENGSPNFRCDPAVTYIFSVTVCDEDTSTCDENSRLSDSAKVEWSTSRQLIPEVFITAHDTTRISAEFNTVCEGGVGGSTKPHYQWIQLGPAGSDLLQDSSNLLTATTSSSLVMKPGLLNGADRCVAHTKATPDYAILSSFLTSLTWTQWQVCFPAICNAG